jgi:hypothetical protein
MLDHLTHLRTASDHNPAPARRDYTAATADLLAAAGIAYRHRPGPPINDHMWLRHGAIETTRFCDCEDPE